MTINEVEYKNLKDRVAVLERAREMKERILVLENEVSGFKVKLARLMDTIRWMQLSRDETPPVEYGG